MNMYQIHKDIIEPVLIKVQSISDDRGLLLPYTDEIDNELFQRSYIVENYGREIIRGLHYHKKEIKMYTVVSGAAKFITVKMPPDIAERNDENEISDYLKANPEVIKTWAMSSRHHCVLGIPPYYANGWIGLEDRTILVSLTNLRYEQAMQDDIRINPYIISQQYWSVKGR
jgi:dTDP-4-dehydrorhamnose 3,5-epimerase-like enzyme